MIFYISLVVLSAGAGFFIDGGSLRLFGTVVSRPAAAGIFAAVAVVGISLAWLFSRVSRRRLFFFFMALGVGKLLSFLIRLILVTFIGRPEGGGITGQPTALVALLDVFFISGSVIYLLYLEGALRPFRFSDLPFTAVGPVADRSGVDYKILDTSVIIDGRIADIVETGFLGGVLVIPQFVLLELQQIADSSDSIKRSRGRRGLDILNKMKKSDRCVIKITDTDFPEVSEVDTKLIELCKKIGGVVITNDFNLNKVAELRGVQVLNINLLTNALKPNVLPGEEMDVTIIKEGKDPNQGIAYLEDGTMIVVDNGRRHINKRIRVAVTSVFQTPAGRMIFSEPL